MVQGGKFTQPFCSEDLSVLLKNEKLKYVLIDNETSVFNPLPPLDKKKFCLSTLPPPPSPPQPRSWKIHAYLLSLPGWAWVISNRKRLANNMKAFIGLLLNWCVLFLLTGLGGLWDPEKSLVLRWLCSSLSCYMKKIIRNFTTKIKLYHTILSSLYKAILTFLINFVGCLTRSRLLEDLWHTTVYCLSPCTYLGHTTECKSGCGIHGSKFRPKIGKKLLISN